MARFSGSWGIAKCESLITVTTKPTEIDFWADAEDFCVGSQCQAFITEFFKVLWKPKILVVVTQEQ